MGGYCGGCRPRPAGDFCRDRVKSDWFPRNERMLRTQSPAFPTLVGKEFLFLLVADGYFFNAGAGTAVRDKLLLCAEGFVVGVLWIQRMTKFVVPKGEV